MAVPLRVCKDNERISPPQQALEGKVAHTPAPSGLLTSNAHDQGGTTWSSCTSLKLRMAFTLDSSITVCKAVT